jgi:hypothetical protein
MITTLGEIGPAAEPALPLLRPFLTSGIYGKIAELAMEKINGEAKAYEISRDASGYLLRKEVGVLN